MTSAIVVAVLCVCFHRSSNHGIPYLCNTLTTATTTANQPGNVPTTIVDYGRCRPQPPQVGANSQPPCPLCWALADKQQLVPVMAAGVPDGGSAATTSATEQGHTPLAELVSDAVGAADTWDLKVFASFIHEYTYHWQGKEQTSKKLVAILVSIDPREYCMGVARARKNKRRRAQGAAPEVPTGIILEVLEGGVAEIREAT
eukprot:14913905-Alexandrium_andersonii.AAC.1